MICRLLSRTHHMKTPKLESCGSPLSIGIKKNIRLILQSVRFFRTHPHRYFPFILRSRHINIFEKRQYINYCFIDISNTPIHRERQS